MHGIFPEPTPELSDNQLLERYAIDRRPYVRFNFVSSLDGSAQVGGVSAALGSAADQRLFKLLRRQARWCWWGPEPCAPKGMTDRWWTPNPRFGARPTALAATRCWRS
ncbi:hypothetical protein [Arthrobacter sp. JCM 19049]|uniref:hypothetical protein n=1 Tax=Arthrobacter sp. JCM 19049 TaxID=1460643 RepID=UPI000B205FF9|nr:hypothetical protein [Arthrobacter sp. JCM 19049]